MRYQFNGFTLDTDRYELQNNGVVQPVEPQVIELLSVLIDNRDRMVTKEEINEKVWRGRIVSEAAGKQWVRADGVGHRVDRREDGCASRRHGDDV
jgi:DNA-binding winged helix-turn-helix (wHTH) protein